MPNTRAERVHKAVGQASPPCDFLARPTFVMHFTTKVCQAFKDLNVLATRMIILFCCIQQASKHLNLIVLRQENIKSQEKKEKKKVKILNGPKEY